MEGASAGGAGPGGAASDGGAGGVPREEARVARRTEGQNGGPELLEELRKAKDDYNMATGIWGRRPKTRRYPRYRVCPPAIPLLLPRK